MLKIIVTQWLFANKFVMSFMKDNDNFFSTAPKLAKSISYCRFKAELKHICTLTMENWELLSFCSSPQLCGGF